MSYRKLYTCRPQNVHIAVIILPPTAVAAADSVLSKWWYLLAVVHGALLCYCTLTPYTTMHTSSGVKIQGKSLVASRATMLKILVALLKKL